MTISQEKLILQKINEFQKKQDIFTRIKEIEFKKQKKDLEEFQKYQQEELKVEMVRIQKKQLDPIMQKIEELKKKQQKRLSENKENKSKEKTKLPNDMCVICLERPMIIALRPCGHICLCQRCARKLQPSNCPVCDSVITGTLKIYFP